MTIRKAIFPVAGLGTRFLPATKSIPKEILTLVDRPLIDYAVEEAREAGIEDFIFVTSRGKSALSDYFDDAPELEARLEAAGKWDALEAVRRATMPSGKIAYVRQNKPLGLGHAVACAAHLIGDEPFAVVLPDDVIRGEAGGLAQLVEAHGKSAAASWPRRASRSLRSRATASSRRTRSRPRQAPASPAPRGSSRSPPRMRRATSPSWGGIF